MGFEGGGSIQPPSQAYQNRWGNAHGREAPPAPFLSPRFFRLVQDMFPVVCAQPIFAEILALRNCTSLGNWEGGDGILDNLATT